MFGMSLTSLIILVVVGLVAGWLAGLIWKGRGFGWLGNLVVGVAGSFIGGYVARLVGFHGYGIPGSIGVALVGALILLFLINLIRRN